MEPYRLKRWKLQVEPDKDTHFFTCARPGRSKDADTNVPDKTVSVWVNGLPGPNTAIISLLGRKYGPEGLSEFSFYTFRSAHDEPLERRRQLSFQEWLDSKHNDLQILVSEHPTYDFQKISVEQIAAIEADIRRFISEGRTVVVVDSGGLTRTGFLCKSIGAIEDSRSES